MYTDLYTGVSVRILLVQCYAGVGECTLLVVCPSGVWVVISTMKTNFIAAYVCLHHGKSGVSRVYGVCVHHIQSSGCSSQMAKSQSFKATDSNKIGHIPPTGRSQSRDWP